jgi:hypothetical protein
MPPATSLSETCAPQPAVPNPFSNDAVDAPAGLPRAITTAAAHLLGSLYSGPVPLECYSPALDKRQLERVVRRNTSLVIPFNGHQLVQPQSFLALAVASGLLPDGSPTAELQRRFAASAIGRARELPLFRDDVEQLRSAMDIDAPLPIDFFAAYAGRTRCFFYFSEGLKKWKCGRHAAAVPSEFAAFLCSRSVT